MRLLVAKGVVALVMSSVMENPIPLRVLQLPRFFLFYRMSRIFDAADNT